MAKYTPKTRLELEKLVKDESIALGDIDTSAITDMSCLFMDSTRRDFSGIESWDTSSVTDMVVMFSGAKYFNHNINSWDTSSVVDMSRMFWGAESFNQPLDKWDTSNVVNMLLMFADATNFNQPLDSWDTSSVKFTSGMFYRAKSFNQNLNTWNVENVIDNQNMFDECPTKQPSQWLHKAVELDNDGKKIENIEQLFQMARKEASLAYWANKITADLKAKQEEFERDFETARKIFEMANQTKQQYLQKSSNGKYTPKTKEELQELIKDESIYLGDIDTSAITDMSCLFMDSTRRDFSGIESWDTSNVVSMTGMFNKAKYFNHNINSWDVSNVEFMFKMFYGADKFNQNLNSWDTSSVRDNQLMFWHSGIENLPKWWKNKIAIKKLTDDSDRNDFAEFLAFQNERIRQVLANPHLKEERQKEKEQKQAQRQAQKQVQAKEKTKQRKGFVKIALIIFGIVFLISFALEFIGGGDKPSAPKESVSTAQQAQQSSQEIQRVESANVAPNSAQSTAEPSVESTASDESVNSAENSAQANTPSESANEVPRQNIQASFDCAKASTRIEKLICSDSELASLDIELSRAYANARNSLDAAGKKVLLDEQRKWLEAYNQCSDKPCVLHNLQIRIKTLQSYGK